VRKIVSLIKHHPFITALVICIIASFITADALPDGVDIYMYWTLGLIILGSFLSGTLILYLIYKLYQIKRKPPIARNGNNIGILALATSIIIGAIVGFMVSTIAGYDYITSTIAGADVCAAAILYYKIYRARRK
jgi:hypothetical protein